MPLVKQLASILMVLFLGSACWVLFSASHPKEESCIVQGNLSTFEGSFKGVKIKYTTDKNADDFASMKEIDVKADGSFNTVINVERHAIVYFFTEKKGYTRRYWSQRLESGGKINDLGEIPISSLYNALSYGEILDKEQAPQMIVFGDPCLKSFDTNFSVLDIKYFKSLQLAAPSCALPKDHVVFAAEIVLHAGAGQRVGYFSLARQPNGEALIVSADQYPSLKDDINFTSSLLAAPKRD